MQFQYEAVDHSKNKQKGRIESNSKLEAMQAIKQQGLFVLHIKEAQASIWKKDINLWLGKPVKNEEFVFFCRQLATLLQSGTTIVQALRLMAEQAGSKPFQEALAQIYEEVRAGNVFSDACEKYPKIFDKVFVNMIRSGEMSGNLDGVMDRLAIFYERENNTRESVKSALTYPVVVAVIAVIVVIFLLTNVIPGFVTSLLASGADIPLPTAIVLAASDALISYWYLFILASVLIVGAYSFARTQPTFKYRLDMFKLKVPVFGILNQKAAIARMCRTLSSLFASAVPVLQSMTMVAEIVNNEVMSRLILESRESLSKGESMCIPLENSDVFPSIVIHMIRVGEETGEMDVMFAKIADFYEADVDQMTSRLSAILEPIMIVILAVIVGVIVLAALLPMFSIYQNV